MKKLLSSLLLVLTCLAGSSSPALATTDALEPFLGEIKWVAFNFAPRGWAFCDGQLLPIAQNTALFSLIGTTYGGDGRTTFALPDLRSRAMVHEGQGPGLTPQPLGQKGGQENVTLTTNQLPAHNHTLRASAANANSRLPHDRAVAKLRRTRLFSNATPDTSMDATAVSSTGGNQSHNNMAPSITLNCIISLTGIFPSRN